MHTIEGVPVNRLELDHVLLCKQLTILNFNTRGDREPVKIPQDLSNMAKSWTLVDKASGRILNMLKLSHKIGW